MDENPSKSGVGNKNDSLITPIKRFVECTEM